MKRRSFITKSIIGGVGITGISKLPVLGKPEEKPGKGRALLTIGICTDLHHDLITDGEARLQSFIKEMNELKPDFIIQMGDFCVPKPANQPLMDIWNQYKGDKYHVIGNHDVDGGFTQDQVVSFWNAKDKYYSFDKNGYHFVVLNGNERPAGDTSKGYPRSITETQRDWLRQDIDSTNLPVIVFCHQGIDNDMDGIKEGAMVRLVFERTNEKAGFKKVQLVLSGHNHEDYLNTYNNVHYLQVNSASYQFSHLKDNGYNFALTQDPLWAVLTIYDNGTMHVKGKQSTYKAGQEKDWVTYAGYPTVPYISVRVINMG